MINYCGKHCIDKITDYYRDRYVQHPPRKYPFHVPPFYMVSMFAGTYTYQRGSYHLRGRYRCAYQRRAEYDRG